MTKVLMFGWEFPPYTSGGLGTACYGLTKSLNNKGIDITFVVPFALESDSPRMKIRSSNFKIKMISSLLQPYITPAQYVRKVSGAQIPSMYGPSLFEEVERYARIAGDIAKQEEFDVIHCHDWLTIGAGLHAKHVSGKPLVMHVHATEFDRTGGNGINQFVYDKERYGMHHADQVIAVSNFTKQKIIEHYGVNPDKIKVVHNGVEWENHSEDRQPSLLKDKKIILFLGRITLQKGPEYFVYAAKKVIEHYPNAVFVMAGNGDMVPFVLDKAAQLGISDKVLFTGFLKGKDIDRAYKMADLYVMPSVSEPFGITPLESMRNGTPVLISKQSGVSEVIKHCLKTDFWDINQMANKILSVCKYDSLHQTLRENGSHEIKKFSWDDPAQKCIDIYTSLKR